MHHTRTWPSASPHACANMPNVPPLRTNSVPNDDRTECICKPTYFEYRDPQAPFTGNCIECPVGAACASTDVRAGIRFEPEGPFAMALDEGHWQDRAFVSNWTSAELSAKLEFVLCPMREITLDDGTVARRTLCTGGITWDTCYGRSASSHRNASLASRQAMLRRAAPHRSTAYNTTTPSPESRFTPHHILSH